MRRFSLKIPLFLLGIFFIFLGCYTLLPVKADAAISCRRDTNRRVSCLLPPATDTDGGGTTTVPSACNDIIINGCTTSEKDDCEARGFRRDTCRVTVYRCTWSCGSTACSSSSSTPSDDYCTHLSDVSCGSSRGTCNYAISNKLDGRCGSSCPVDQSTVNLTTSCSAGNPVITATWADVPHADYYDVQRRHYINGAWTSWTPSSPDKVNDGTSATYSKSYTVGNENTQYQVRVRTHTVAGYAGPTTWKSDTVTTGACTTPTPTPSCTINWSSFPSVVAQNQSYTFPVTFNSNFGTRWPSVYLDGWPTSLYRDANSAGYTSNSVTVNITLPAQASGNYNLNAWLNNSAGTGVRCTPDKPFTVVAPKWYQTIGGDIRQDDLISVPIPSGKYFSAAQSTPLTLAGGIIYTSQASASFGSGTANQTNWVVRSNTFSPTPPGIKTSYAFVDANITKSNSCAYNMYGVDSISGSDSCPVLTSFVCSGDIPNCTLSPTMPSGTYKRDGDVTLTGSDYTFPANGDFVFLINGNLTIDQNLTVPNTSTAIFIVSGDITVNPNVTSIAGIFSADKNFIIGSNIPDASDQQLNVSGNVIANAGLATANPLTNDRDLVALNSTTPSFAITYRPDFILHLPNFLKKSTYSVAEVAPQGGSIVVPSNTPTPTITPTPTPTPTLTPTPTPAGPGLYKYYRLWVDSVYDPTTANSTQLEEMELLSGGVDKATGGTITASGENTTNGETKDKAFDNLTTTKWLTFQTSNAWIAYQFPSSAAYTVDQYSITSGNDGPERDPKNFRLQGSNDGTNWTTLDIRTNVAFSARLQRQVFIVGGGTATPPSAPSGLTTSTFCQNTASGTQFDWAAAAGATSYQQSYNNYTPVTVTTNSRRVPADTSCTTGPGGCSYGYDLNLPWWVKACNTYGCSAQVNGTNWTTKNCAPPTPTPVPATPTPTPIPTSTYKSQCNSVNVRASSNTSGTIVTQVDLGDLITTVGTVTGGSYSGLTCPTTQSGSSTSWLKITKINGTSVSSKYGYTYLYVAKYMFKLQ